MDERFVWMVCGPFPMSDSTSLRVEGKVNYKMLTRGKLLIFSLMHFSAIIALLLSSCS